MSEWFPDNKADYSVILLYQRGRSMTINSFSVVKIFGEVIYCYHELEAPIVDQIRAGTLTEKDWGEIQFRRKEKTDKEEHSRLHYCDMTEVHQKCLRAEEKAEEDLRRRKFSPSSPIQSKF
jgi:hypothetical protein